MDAKLRELERKAQTDHDAALQLASALKRLITNQWQAVPCNAVTKNGLHRGCSDCGGQEFLRVNVSELNEYTPRHDRNYEVKPLKEKWPSSQHQWTGGQHTFYNRTFYNDSSHIS